VTAVLKAGAPGTRIAFAKTSLADVTIGDQLHALNVLGRHLGLFTDKVHVSGGLTLEQLVMGSLGRDDEPEATLPEAAE
jgi:hypothetical protein